MEVEDEESVVHKKKAAEKKSTKGKKNYVRGERNQEKEKQIMVKKKEFNDQEKEKENKKIEKDENNENEENSRRDKAVNEGKEVPYLVVPSKKEKDRLLARFLDIFRKLEITMPFREALQQMSLYSKFLKDVLTRKHKNIH